MRREAFVDAAQRLLQAKGYEHTSIQDVLDEVGASRGAFYHYFASKTALLEAVVTRMVDASLASVAPVLDDPALDAVARFEGLFGGRVPFFVALADGAVCLGERLAVVLERIAVILVIRVRFGFGRARI